MSSVLAPALPSTTPKRALTARLPIVALTRDRALFGALLLGTGMLYLVGLSRSGWANQYYSAAVRAGLQSWKAMLFGSLDSSNFITVDKPPASLWVTEISARIFGVNSWSVLAPQALEGVAAVALLYAAIRRVATPSAGLLAGAVLATTPVAALMFRFNNPDALLVLLLTAGGYATVRAVEAGRARWLVLAGVLLGLAFLTKMSQAFLVVPGFAAAYLVAAPVPVRKRILHTLGAGIAMLVAAGWWVAVVELWPAGSRPYIGGTNHNSVLELIFGYNGIGRLTGSSNNGNVSGGTGGFSSGSTGWTRLFGSDMGTQISWLLPAALVGVLALAWLTATAGRTDRLRASLIVWGGWLLVTAVLLSFASGIIHPYYTVALAPAIAAVVALAVTALWQHRSRDAARWTLAGLLGTATVWAFDLLGRTSWQPWLRWAVLIAGAAAVGAVLARRLRAPLVAPLIVATLLGAPSAYAVQTAATAHSGALPSAGPASRFGFGGGFAPPGGAGGLARFRGGGAVPGAPAVGFGTRPTGSSPGVGGGVGRGAIPGGLGGAATVSTALRAALVADANSYRWAAATTSANEAASLELATGHAIMSLGGYNGTDPAISLAAFEKLVSAGNVHYYVSDPQGFIGSTAASTSNAYAIQRWVTSHFAARTIGGRTVYDLTAARS